MKKLLLIIIVFAFTQGVYAQSEKQINDINQSVLIIKNGLPKNSPADKTWTGDTVQSVIRDNDKVSYVCWKRIENYTIIKHEYFFSNEKLIFYEESRTDLDQNVVKDQKYYIADTHLLSWISDETAVAKTSKEFSDMDLKLSMINNDWTNCKPFKKTN